MAAYDLNRVFFIGGDSLCMAEFGGGNASANRENVLKSLHERILKYRNAKNLDKDNNLYWISPSAQRPDVGYLYVLTPIYIGNKLEALLGIEQTVRLEDFVTAGNLPIGVTLLDENNEPVLRGGRRSLCRFAQQLSRRARLLRLCRQLSRSDPEESAAAFFAEHRLCAAGEKRSRTFQNADPQRAVVEPAVGHRAVHAGVAV